VPLNTVSVVQTFSFANNTDGTPTECFNEIAQTNILLDGVKISDIIADPSNPLSAYVTHDDVD